MIRVYRLGLILMVAPLFSAQAGPREQLMQALAMERDGRAEQAIAALRALLDSKSLDAPETGLAWNILGLTYKDKENFIYAQHVFEETIRILEPSPDHTRAYGIALENFPGLLLSL